MRILTQQEICEALSAPIFHTIGRVADAMGVACYLIGGYVRDLFLERPSKDIDVVVVGSGIEVAKALVSKLGRGAHLSVFRNFGTAQVKWHGLEIEFVGARKESYQRDSRKPIVEDGTLQDDLERRDFSINAMGICLNANRFGELIDPFYGQEDMEDRLIRTPLDPDITFSDDPLRMMRCIRFATQLRFQIEEETFDAITRNRERISIISQERIIDELNKIMLSPTPSIGFVELQRSGLLELIFPELAALDVRESRKGRSHKNIFYHTLEVLDNVAKLEGANHTHLPPRGTNVVSSSLSNSSAILAEEQNCSPSKPKIENVSAKRVSHGDGSVCESKGSPVQEATLWLRWAALLHDIGKPRCKSFDPVHGWTFHNHNYVGSRMVPGIFRRMKLPMDERMKYVQKLVDLHMRPIAISDEEVTDSAVRRLLFDAGDDIDDLMALCDADITSRNEQKKQRFRDNFQLVRRKLVDLEEKDRIRNFQPPVSGEEIMATFGLQPSAEVGAIKMAIKDAILDGKITNNHEAAYAFMLRKGACMGLKVIEN